MNVPSRIFQKAHLRSFAFLLTTVITLEASNFYTCFKKVEFFTFSKEFLSAFAYTVEILTQNLITFPKIFENYFRFKNCIRKSRYRKRYKNALIAAYLFLRQNEKCKLKPELNVPIEAYTF